MGLTRTVAGLACAAALIGCTDDPRAASRPGAPVPLEDLATIQARLRESCTRDRATKLAEYQRLMDARQFWPAASVIRPCAAALSDQQLSELVKAGEVASHLADINNKAAPARTRAAAMQTLARDYPEVGRKYEAEAARLFAQADAADRKAHAAQLRREGVRIGMTAQDVLDSSWGRPAKVNRTTTASGTREQWVYPSGNYLYLENGILTAVQN